MKNTFFRSVAVAAVLAVGAVSCAPLQQSSGGDYYDPSAPAVSSAPSRIWVDDPYRPGASILMERDPYSGRYYPVQGPYNAGVYSQPYGTYDPYYNSRVSGSGYGRRGGYGRRDAGAYRPARPSEPAPTVEQRREQDQQRKEAAGSILGRKRQ